MIKKGIYCSKKQKEAEDEHGGAKVKVPYYNHLCFYTPEKLVGYYGGSKMWLTPFLERKFRYSGELIKTHENRISFFVDDPYNNDRLFFDGSFVNDVLNVRVTRQSEPGEVFEDEFEYIGTGESQA